MFKTYSDIYDKRGHLYHEAMQRWSDARHLEFETLIQVAGIDHEAPLVVDVPSGGGYLAGYLPDRAKLVSVDAAPNFLNSGSHDEAYRTICAKHGAIPMEDASADVILSLAGLHHIDEPEPVFREWHRLLKAGGILTIGDAEAGSPTAEFLDGVVGQFNRMGHEGKYLTVAHATLLETIGFKVTLAEVKPYAWQFRDRSNMLDYCRMLFCMDRDPSDEELLGEITRTVGFVETEHGCRLNWALFFLRAVKV